MKTSMFNYVACVVLCALGVNAEIMLEALGSEEGGHAGVFELAPLAAIVGSKWKSTNKFFLTREGEDGLVEDHHSKRINHGMVARAKNQRTGTVGSLVFWEKAHDEDDRVFSMWNPFGHGNSSRTVEGGEWQEGDKVALLDYPLQSKDQAEEVTTYFTEGSKWDLPETAQGLGHIGVVSPTYFSTTFQIDLGLPFSITNVWFESESLKYELFYEKDNDWVLAQANCKGNCMEDGRIESSLWGLKWEGAVESSLMTVQYEALGVIHSFPVLLQQQEE